MKKLLAALLLAAPLTAYGQGAVNPGVPYSNIGPARVTPTGGTAGTLANLLAGQSVIPGTHIVGTPLIQVCDFAAQVSGGCPTNPYSFMGFSSQITTSHGPNIPETGGDFELLVDTGSGGNPSDPGNSKTGLYSLLIAEPGAGNSWAAAFNAVFQSGSIIGGTPFGGYGLEIDMANQTSVDCSPGGACFMPDLWLAQGAATTSPITMFQQISAASGSVYGAHYGIIINGPLTTKDVGFYDTSGDTVSFQAAGNKTGGVAFNNESNRYDGFQDIGTEGQAGFLEAGTAPVGFQANGTLSSAAFAALANTPIDFWALGTASTAAFYDGATSPDGILLAGTHSDGDIKSAGASAFGLIFTGNHTTADIATFGDSVTYALEAGAGQRVCFNTSGACIKYTNPNIVFDTAINAPSLTLTTPLALAQGGTGGTSASIGRASLGAAASGANSDITSLTGLTTPLTQAQGGTGATGLGSATFTPTLGSSGNLNQFLSGSAGIYAILASSGFYINGNLAGSLPPLDNFSVNWNYSGTSGEDDFFNGYYAGSALPAVAGFSWYQWTTTSSAALIARLDALGNFSTLSSLSSTKLKITGTTTVASLPACNSGSSGQIQVVSDALAPTYGTVLVGGGSVNINARCNGANWVAD